MCIWNWRINLVIKSKKLPYEKLRLRLRSILSSTFVIIVKYREIINRLLDSQISRTTIYNIWTQLENMCFFIKKYFN